MVKATEHRKIEAQSGDVRVVYESDGAPLQFAIYVDDGNCVVMKEESARSALLALGAVIDRIDGRDGSDV